MEKGGWFQTLYEFYIPFVGIMMLFVSLIMNRSMKRSLRYLFIASSVLALLTCATQTFTIYAEQLIQDEALALQYRQVFTTLSVSFEIGVVCLVSYISLRPPYLKKRYLFLLLPMLFTWGVYLAALMNPNVMAFDSDGHLIQRFAPYGYTFVVSVAFYIFFIIVTTILNIKKRAMLESVTVFVPAGFCLISLIFWAIHPAFSRGEMAIYALIFYYMYFQSSTYKEREDQMKYDAEHDSLTELYNRRGFQRISSELSEKKKPLIFALVDIDRFKTINDRYGHATGDEILRRVAERMNYYFPRYCYIFRVGGDEFSIIYCADDAIQNEGAFLRTMNDINQDLSSSSSSTPSISLSYGVVASPDSYTKETFLTADKRLYEAKKAKNIDSLPDC